jgi:hypothetical protein
MRILGLDGCALASHATRIGCCQPYGTFHPRRVSASSQDSVCYNSRRSHCFGCTRFR